MGQEALCNVRYQGNLAAGKALLETDHIAFRGGLRLKIQLKEIESLAAHDGLLEVTWPAGQAAFELGAKAEKWAHAIRNPRSRADKLGIKAGQRISILGILDEAFVQELRDRDVELHLGEAVPDADLVFYEADEPADLARLAELRQAIRKAGAVWVVSPKGKSARIRDTDVMAAARDIGLVDTKVVAFSDTHTALKLVLPVALRK